LLGRSFCGNKERAESMNNSGIGKGGMNNTSMNGFIDRNPLSV
jgi:hypothetical protein